MDKQLRIFIYKYITKYFLFGYCYLAGILLDGLIMLVIIQMPIRFAIKYTIIYILTLVSIWGITKLIKIVSLTKRKYRFYILVRSYFDKGNFPISILVNGMFDPCYQVIIKDLCHEYGFDYRYLSLIDLKHKQKYPIEY